MKHLATKARPAEDIGWLVESIVRMFRPIVRFAVGRVSCSALVDLVQLTYVQEARDYLKNQNPERKVTRSALALLCGMDGRAIKSLEERSERSYVASDICSEAAILEMWSRDEMFLDSTSGEPKRLLIHGPQGTFQRLVSRAAGRAVTPQTAMERLLESGNIRLSDDELYVSMIDVVYMPVHDSEKTTVEAGSLAMSRLGRAINHNVHRDVSRQPSWLQQDRWSTRIPRSRLDALRQEIRELLKRQIGEVEQHLEAEEKRPSESPECLVGIGWYYWEQTPDNDPGD